MTAQSDRGDEARYRVGCPGMFVLGTESAMSDELDALLAACDGPPGCEVLDTHTGKWIGPYCPEDDVDIRERHAARKAERSAA